MFRVSNNPPTDFLAYLQVTLGTGEEATVRLLGAWLESYEPVSRRRLPTSPIDRDADVGAMDTMTA